MCPKSFSVKDFLFRHGVCLSSLVNQCNNYSKGDKYDGQSTTFF